MVDTLIKVDGRGIILTPLDRVWRQGTYLVDYIHLNDRIAFLSFLNDLREGREAQSVRTRFSAGRGERFVDGCISFVDAQKMPLEEMKQISTEKEWVGKAHADCSFILSLQLESIEPASDYHQLSAGSTVYVAHEMRTPLNALLGFSDLLAHQLEADDLVKHREMITMIQKAGQHLLSVIDRILLPAETTMRGHLEHKGVLVEEIIEEIIALTRPLHGARRVLFSPENQGMMCAIDGLVLRQVFLNILSNAIKYTDENGTIMISVKKTEGGMATLIVDDDGIGFGSNCSDILKRPFYRADNARAHTVSGYGLGLYLVQQSLAQYGGYVELHAKQSEYPAALHNAFQAWDEGGTQAMIYVPIYEGGKKQEAKGTPPVLQCVC